MHSEATTIRSPVSDGPPCAAGPWLAAQDNERRADRGAEQSQPADSRRSRSPAKSAAATASSTGMAPTISEAWLTVVQGQAVKLEQKLNGNAEERGDAAADAVSRQVSRTRLAKRHGSMPRQANRKR